jgi:hypothetical protein
MTAVNKCQHPDGTVFECVAPYRVFKNPLGPGYLQVNDKHGKAGVRITRPDGVVIFRPNEFYNHIEPLKPNDR